MSNYVEDLEEILEDVASLLVLMATAIPAQSSLANQIQQKINTFKDDYRGRKVSEIIYDPTSSSNPDYDKFNLVEDIS
jgi:GTP:adenosylcobinamide-phosphate guanylyltransferase